MFPNFISTLPNTTRGKQPRIHTLSDVLPLSNLLPTHDEVTKGRDFHLINRLSLFPFWLSCFNEDATVERPPRQGRKLLADSQQGTQAVNPMAWEELNWILILTTRGSLEVSPSPAEPSSECPAPAETLHSVVRDPAERDSAKLCPTPAPQQS